MRRSVALALALLLATAVRAASPPPVAFIVSTRRDVQNLTTGDLRRIFLGQISRWRDGPRIVLFVRSAKTPEGRVFLDRLMHMSDIDYAQWWIGAIFRGDAAAAPRSIGSPDAMIKAVAANANAIGFIVATEDPPHDVNVIAIDGRLPSDRGYPLR